jgi:hypothetical protein
VASVPLGFDASPSVVAWIKQADPDKREAFTDLLLTLKDHPLPGTSLLRISPHEDPSRAPASFNVPFDACLLNYRVPLRAEEPIRLLVVLDPFTIPPRESLEPG